MLSPVLTTVYQQLEMFAGLKSFWADFDAVFGMRYDRYLAQSIRSQWLARDFSQLPEIAVISRDILGNAQGAYAAIQNTIYLADWFVETASPQALEAVILEEIGHFVDAQVNSLDTPGDEGALFSALVHGENLNQGQLQQLKAENDSATLNFDGNIINVEMANVFPAFAPVSINDVTVTEGETAVFTVALSQPYEKKVFGRYFVRDWTALMSASHTDFSGGTGFITFEPGETQTTISVVTIDDLIAENTENFIVELSSLYIENTTTNLLAESIKRIGTILDNDVSNSFLDITSLSYPVGTPENPTVFYIYPDSERPRINIDFGYDNNTEDAVYIYARGAGVEVASQGGYFDTDSDYRTNFGDFVYPKSGASGQDYTIGSPSSNGSWSTRIGKINPARISRERPGEITSISLLMQQRLPDGNYGTLYKEVSIPVNYLFMGYTDLSVTKSASSDQAKVEEEFTYTISVNNIKGFSVDNFLLTETLPKGVTFVRASFDGPGKVEVEQRGDTTILNFSLEKVGLSESRSKSIDIVVIPTQESRTNESSNEWKIMTESVVTFEEKYIIDPDSTNNSIEREFTVTDPDPDLVVSINTDKDWIGIGPDYLMTYNFVVTNEGGKSATGTQLTITIPKGIEIVGRTFVLPEVSVDEEGNTLVKVNVEKTLEKNDSFTGTVVVQATGFSQPLANLQNHLWDIDVLAEVKANETETNTSNNSSTKTIRIDSSKGLVEQMAKVFVDKMLPIEQELGTKLSDVQKPLRTSFASLLPLGIAYSYPAKFYSNPPQNYVEDPALLERATEIKNTLDSLPQNQQDVLNQAKSKIVSSLESLISDSVGKWLLNGLREYLKGSIPNLPEGVNLNFQNDQLKVDFTSGNFKVTINSSLPGLSQLPTDLVRSGLGGNVPPVKNALNGIVDDSSTQVGFEYKTERLNLSLTTKLENISGEILDSQLNSSINFDDELQVQATIKYDPVTKSHTYEGIGSYSYKFWKDWKLDIGLGTSNQKSNVDIKFGVSGSFNKTQQVEKNFNSFSIINSFRTLVENNESETAESSLQKFNLADVHFPPQPLIEIISYGTDGNQSNGKSETAITSSNGQFIVFNSDATNLITNDTNNFTDSFIVDLQTNKTEIISVSTDGIQGNGKSEVFAISADGRFVMFASDANNLVTNDTNDVRDIFLRDRQTQTTELISKATDGSQANGISDLGSISADGRYVVFSSIASNLVAGDTNDVVDVFVRDLQTGTTERVSLDSNNLEANNDSFSSGGLSISADGRYVVFNSYASNLVAGDTNETIDIFVRDLQTGTTIRINVSSDGTEANDISLSPVISADGRYVVFSSLASNLVAGDTNDTSDIFVYDQQTKSIELVSVASDGIQADNNSMSPSISADGRYVVFESLASNLGIENPDFYSNIYLHDRQTGETKPISSAPINSPDGDSTKPTISGNGKYIAFDSGAKNLVEEDNNDVRDIFVYKNDIGVSELPTLNNPITDQNGTEDTPFNFLLLADTFSDPNEDALTLTATLDDGSALPAWLTFNSDTGTFSGTPRTDADTGVFNIKVTATDPGGLAVSDTFALNVTAVNDTPVLANPISNQTATQDQAFNFVVPANTFTDEENDPLTLTATLGDNSPLPGWLTFDPATGTLSGTPDNANVGALTIQVIANDGNDSTSGVFGLTVNAVIIPEPPTPPVTPEPPPTSIDNEIQVVVTDNSFFVKLTDGTQIVVKYQNQPFENGSFGNWQILEAEIVNGINQILWRNPDTGEIGIWNTDANWNWVSSETWPANSLKTLDAEVTFQIDLNNDELLGDRLTSIEAEGSVSFLEGIFGNYYVRTGDGLTEPIKYLGEAFKDNVGNWQALAAETVEGINQVLWQNLSTGEIGVWNADSNWNWLSSDVFAAGSPEALAQAGIFSINIGGTTVV